MASWRVIPVVAEEQRLHCALCAVCRPCLWPDFRVARGALLVVHWDDGAAVRFDEIDLGDESKPLAGDLDRGRMDAFVGVQRVGVGQLAALAVDARVTEAALEG